MTRAEEQRTNYQAIVDAATELFLEKGIDKTGVAEIAEKANLSAMSVYRYFGTKKSIAVAVANHLVRTYLAEHRQRCAEAEQPNENGFERFSRIIRCHVATYEAHPEYVTFLRNMGSYSMREGLSYHLDYMRFGAVEVSGLDTPARDALAAGIEDGSIRGDIDVEMTRLALANLLTGGCNFGDLLEERKEINIIRHAAEMIIYYTKA